MNGRVICFITINVLLALAFLQDLSYTYADIGCRILLKKTLNNKGHFKRETSQPRLSYESSLRFGFQSSDGKVLEDK